ncbi:LysE family translocator [Nocardioides pocheonensis]|uniref:LysE family translocator n=1 Tax=Nocardioides pocheonensis TaxID=661485 RepID=UPI00161E0567|nr:LysE family translocator [Nocardioides pocheonensis]
MPASGQWVAFLVASFLFIQVPGPSLLFMLGRALTVSLREALLSVAGNASGLLTQAVLVAIGLGAVVAASATAYLAVKLIGAAYVVWLGVQAFRHRRDARLALSSDMRPPERARAALTTGFVVGVTNPKTVLFFIAFLPQFTSASAPAAPQVVLLGLVFASMALVSDSVWATLAGKARTWLARRPQRLDTLGAAGGVMMIGLGTTLLVAE